MSERYCMDTSYSVYDLHSGTKHTPRIDIQPSGDFPGNVVLVVPPEHEDFFGKLHLDLPAPMMRLIGQALIKCADNEEGKNV